MVHEISAAIATVVERVGSGMVRISNGRRGSGAGTIVHESGLILTNAHVLRSEFVHIQLRDDRTFKGELIGRDPKLDLAVILIEGEDLPTIQMGDSDNILPGELVFSLGYPWGIQGGLTYGIVIQNGAWPVEDRQNTADLLTASLHLRPGHSGGPMFNSRGEVIGLNTMMQGPDVGVAVPIDQAKRFLKRALDIPREKTV